MADTTFKHHTREAWLEAAVALMTPWFAPLATLPSRVRVSIGFPSCWSRKNLNANKAIGQCWYRESAADGVPQVFISPVLDEPVRVLDVLVHELVHASVGAEAGHRTPFKRVAVALGLEGRMTATTASPALHARLAALIETELGPYPHAALQPNIVTRQTTRMRLIQCVECDYKLRGALSTLERGVPQCPLCGELMAMS